MRTIVLFYFLTTGMLHAQTTVQNPLLPGFYPDPSIEKVGKDYYMVNSTFSYMPGIPIFHSRDLKNWVQLGNVIHRDEQLDFMGEQVSRGLFAPSISYHHGIYYVACTDIDNEGNFVVTSKDPQGPWSSIKQIPQVQGIDPSIYFDKDTDKAYIVYNSGAPDDAPLYEGHRSIRMYEFDYKNLRVVGEEHLLVNGGAAEGGTSVHHSQVIFRSQNIDGPYKPWQNNPILTQRHLDENR